MRRVAVMVILVIGLAGAAWAQFTVFDPVNYANASITHGLEALGFLRGHQMSVETTIRHLEDDTYSDDPTFNTQIAVLNKLNATTVTSARLAKDTNNVLVSLLEQQLLEATDRREAAVQGINAQIGRAHV